MVPKPPTRFAMSQGMSIDRLAVSFDGIFECGQAYVALSRARTLEGLVVEGFHSEAVRVHPRCVACKMGVWE